MNDTPSPRPQLPALRTGGNLLAIIPQSMEEAYRIANAAVKSGLVHRDMGTPERALMVIMHGMEIGLPPMASLERIAIINGRRCVWGDAVPALAMDTGELIEWDEGFAGDSDNLDTFYAYCRIARRRGDAVFRKEGRFSVADAKQADLWDERPKVTRRSRDGGTYEANNDSPWYRYRKRMLQMRARVVFRDLFADKFMGLYIAEEMVGRDSDAEMRDVTPRDFRKVENPMAEQSPAAEEMASHNTEAALDHEAIEAEAPRQIDLEEAIAKKNAEEGTPVAEKQQPQEARTEPAGASEPLVATRQPAEPKTEPAASLQGAVDRSNAANPNTPPLEVLPTGPSGQSGGYYETGLAIIANAVDPAGLNQWWRSTRKERTAAGLTADQLDKLTQSYQQKFMILNGG